MAGRTDQQHRAVDDCRRNISDGAQLRGGFGFFDHRMAQPHAFIFDAATFAIGLTKDLDPRDRRDLLVDIRRQPRRTPT